MDETSNKDKDALVRAYFRGHQLSSDGAKLGFDWDNPIDVLGKLEEEVQELRMAIESQDEASIQDEFGDVLFTILSLERHLSLDLATSLEVANQKFENRWRAMNQLIAEQELEIAELSLEQLESFWQKAKKLALPTT